MHALTTPATLRSKLTEREVTELELELASTAQTRDQVLSRWGRLVALRENPISPRERAALDAAHRGDLTSLLEFPNRERS